MSVENAYELGGVLRPDGKPALVTTLRTLVQPDHLVRLC